MKRARKWYVDAAFTVLWLLGATGPGTAKEMIEYFLPIPIDEPLTSNPSWGSSVAPRDVNNGLESQNNEWHYWYNGTSKLKQFYAYFEIL